MSLSVEQLKEILLSCLDEERNVTDMTGALDVITKLQTVTINRETLEGTRLGLLVNDIRRKNQETNPQLGKLCRGLIKDWQKLVSPASAQSGGGNLGVSPAPERLATPSSRTTTPRQTATAKLIAESGLRCSPSPAYTPKLQPTTPMLNGRSSTGASPESSQQRGPTATSSYAPSEQQLTTNGPAQSALKIRIKYGSADQQASIVREIDPSSPRIAEHVQSANESANANQGAEEAANRRKRKKPDQVQRTSLGLVNGGSKSVSPCTSAVPSPIPILVNVTSPASVPPAEPTTVVAPVTKTAKKSKSTSPDVGPTPAMSSSLLQRPKLKSTAELVAEMTSSYPETMSISLKNVVPKPASPPTGVSVATGPSIMASVLAAEAATSDASDGDDDSKDEDYKEPGSSNRKAKVVWTSSLISDRNNSGYRNVNKTELLDRYFRDHSSGGVESRRHRREKVKDKAVVIESTTGDHPTRTQVVHPPIDWYSAVQLPPIDLSVLETCSEESEEMEQCMVVESGQEVCDKKKETVELDSNSNVGKLLDSCAMADDVEQATSSCESGDGVQWRSRLLKTTKRGDRQVLAMPYVDIGLPDFLEYGYTNREQYLAHWSER